MFLKKNVKSIISNKINMLFIYLIWILWKYCKSSTNMAIIFSPRKLVSFIKGHKILNRILVDNEVVYEARKRKRELILFKVHFEKTYDSVKWDYLDKVMTSMNFSMKWEVWILTCLSSALASILVNGFPTVEFFLKCEIHQGDLLSLFLFL